MRTLSGDRLLSGAGILCFCFLYCRASVLPTVVYFRDNEFRFKSGRCRQQDMVKATSSQQGPGTRQQALYQLLIRDRRPASAHVGLSRGCGHRGPAERNRAPDPKGEACQVPVPHGIASL